MTDSKAFREAFEKAPREKQVLILNIITTTGKLQEKYLKQAQAMIEAEEKEKDS